MRSVSRFDVLMSLSMLSPQSAVSGLSWLSNIHVYRLAYVYSLCICMGQLLSGYGMSKGGYVLLVSTLGSVSTLSTVLMCVLVVLLGLWYPMTWLMWLYTSIRPGGVVSTSMLYRGGGYRLPSVVALFWSWLIVSQAFVLFCMMLLYM
jgi:hypothetical protein